MKLSGIKALTFNTGGTLLDWHTGFRDAFSEAGRRHGIDRDWGQIANRFRRLSLKQLLARINAACQTVCKQQAGNGQENTAQEAKETKSDLCVQLLRLTPRK